MRAQCYLRITRITEGKAQPNWTVAVSCIICVILKGYRYLLAAKASSKTAMISVLFLARHAYDASSAYAMSMTSVRL